MPPRVLSFHHSSPLSLPSLWKKHIWQSLASFSAPAEGEDRAESVGLQLVVGDVFRPFPVPDLLLIHLIHPAILTFRLSLSGPRRKVVAVGLACAAPFRCRARPRPVDDQRATRASKKTLQSLLLTSHRLPARVTSASPGPHGELSVLAFVVQLRSPLVLGRRRSGSS
jgi:hypothetical protein